MIQLIRNKMNKGEELSNKDVSYLLKNCAIREGEKIVGYLAPIGGPGEYIQKYLKTPTPSLLSAEPTESIRNSLQPALSLALILRDDPTISPELKLVAELSEQGVDRILQYLSFIDRGLPVELFQVFKGLVGSGHTADCAAGMATDAICGCGLRSSRNIEVQFFSREKFLGVYHAKEDEIEHIKTYDGGAAFPSLAPGDQWVFALPDLNVVMPAPDKDATLSVRVRR